MRTTSSPIESWPWITCQAPKPITTEMPAAVIVCTPSV